MADGDAQRRGAQRFERLSTETKQAFKTTEFWALVAVVVGILIASAIIGEADGGGNGGEGDENQTDAFPAIRAWLYVTIAASAYMVSRGLAKAGSRDPYWADRDDRPGDNRAKSDRN